MNEASESSRVVNLSQRMDPSSERVGELLSAVRNIASKRLQQWVSNAFEQVDDALFDLAEKAESNAAQMHYFDGMREVRKRRPSVERHYLDDITRKLGDLAHPGKLPAPTTTATPVSLGSIELSLVADNELEESLAITSMISKHESRLAGDLFAVNQRLSVICGGHKIDDASNPVAPAILAQAFRQALQELVADMRVKLIIYKLFDRYVLSQLEDLYQGINTELVRAGVLPQLRHRVVRGGSPSQAGGVRTSSSQVADASGVSEEAGEIPNDLLQTLHALFSARRAPAGGNIGMRSTTGPLPSANELLGALSVLQSQIASAGPLPNVHGSDALELSLEVAQLKEHLLTQIGALRGERPSHVANMDEDTIDLVGMLFEFILEDRNLPTNMQVMLARLQIPYLKAAILDRKLFAHRQHPARTRPRAGRKNQTVTIACTTR
jgi:hypothetical protein